VGLILAVDGGNSKTDVALVDTSGAVLATGRGPGFAPQVVGVARAMASVDAAIAAAGGVGPGVDHVSACLAGADLPVEEETLAAAFAARGFPDVVVRNDTFALLRAGCDGPPAAAVVCGAGINAVAVATDGRVARFPALGRISGDFGGGIDLGTETLWAAVRAEDGRGPATSLERLVRQHFGVAAVSEVTLGLHFGDMTFEKMGELVPGLLDAAAEGDRVAGAIVARMADEVVVLAEVALRRLDLLGERSQVVLGGGVLTARHPLLTRLVTDGLAQRVPHGTPSIVDAPPILGAALLGLERLGATPDALSRTRAHRSWS
jgi:N-acetylglucosamine kinase-like BadF-type ATPase